MKRLRMWLRELSLSQQLLTIVFLFLTVFAVFVFVFLSERIESFSEKEMYRILHSSQEDMIVFVENGQVTEGSGNKSTLVADYIYDPAGDTFIILSGDEISGVLADDIRRNAASQTETTVDYKLDALKENPGKGEYLYTMTLMKDGRVLVSVMTDLYRNEFHESLIDSVVMMNVLFISVLFVLLMLWVSSLIIPLSQIKTYITKLKNDEHDAVLNVRRNDEIGEVADALRDMEMQLASDNRVKQEMIQNISHDLKTPIATIKSYSEAVKDGIYPYDTLEKSVDVIIEHADRLEKKVKSLIVLNKMDYLLDTCELGDNLNMNEVVEKVLLSLRVIRPEITFVKNMNEQVYFHGDEEPWRIAVENLIDNALRYAKTNITITLHRGEMVISNDGSQISEDVIEKLFHPYEKGNDGQFGLGLSIVYRVATTYGYHVNAENMTDGVAFRVWKDVPKKERNRKEKAGKDTV